MRRRAAFFACLLASAGCGDESRTVSLVFELAPTAADVGVEGCSVAPDVEPAPLPEQVDHVQLEICRHTEAGCERVPLTTPDGDHASASPGILLELGSGRSFEVDGRLGGGPLRVEAVVCDGTSLVARGVADRVRFGSKAVRVRLYRYRAASCAGPRRAGGSTALPAPRAFHAAAALPNGDVLVYGGVTGDAPSTPGPGADGLLSWAGVTLQRAIEVYDVSEERFVTLDAELGRVLFASALLPSAPEQQQTGPFVVRVVGGFGFETDDGRPAIRFDSTQGRTYLAAPLLPGADVRVRPSVDLVYYPDPPRVEVRDAPIAGNPTGAANAMAAPLSGAPGAVALGLEEGFREPDPAYWTMGGEASWPNVRPNFWFLTEDGARNGDPGELLAARFGHTVTPVAAAGPGAALVWGGNVHEVDLAVVEAEAGELLRPGSAPAAIAAGGATTLPHPTAFHSASALSADTILFAGGLRVGCVGTGCMGRGFSTSYGDPPLHALQWQAGAFVPLPVDNTLFTPAFLHTATAVPGVDPIQPVVLIGGAVASGTSRLEASDQVVWVGPTDVGRFGTLPFAGIERLIHARWAHAVAPLPQERLLVTGGMQRRETRLVAIGQAEVLAWGELPADNPCAGAQDGGVGGFDAGSPFDAGIADGGPDAGAAGTDAAVVPADSGL